MTTARKLYPETVEHMFRGLPFAFKLGYTNELGGPVDLTGKNARIQFRAEAKLTSPSLYTASVANGKITTGVGFIKVALLTAAETLLVTQDYLVGTLIIEEVATEWKPVVTIIVRVQDSTTLTS